MPNFSLSTDQIISNINRGITFEAEHNSGAFYLKIEEYDPYVCMAIHDGHRLRNELEIKCNLNDKERWYEEDPETGGFIGSLPIVLIARDSRYEYDLNRPVEECVYTEAWGKEVWKTPLSKEELNTSHHKHNEFYRVVDALISKIEKLFKACLVFDIHSYNHKRYDRELPVFNIGAINIDSTKYGKYISNWQHELSKIVLPNIISTVAINDIFKGNGYLLKHIISKFDHTLVFATEIKKIYCDEETGELYPLVIQAIQEQFKTAIINSSFYFAKRETNLKIIKKNKLLSSELDKDVIAIDKQLYNLVRSFEVLPYINPINIEQERKKFFKSKYTVDPEFRYAQLNINPYEFKRALFSLKVENIKDISVQNLYKDVINAYADKIDMISSIGTPNFLYNSLRYYGKPDTNDIENANFLLYAIETNHSNGQHINATEALPVFKDFVANYGFDCKIRLSQKIVAKAQVINHKRTLVLRKDASFSPMGLKALLHHEIGVHMVTTINALHQPLKIFSIGLPINDRTQEGLAICSEYLSGNINVQRLRDLALRVLAVDMMTKGQSFQRTFEYLIEDQDMDPYKAFYLTSRVFRGGGFTKDHVYLKGFKEIIQFLNSGYHLENLLIGKTSLEYIGTINEMIDRKMLLPPKYKTEAFTNTENNDATLNYLISCIK